MGQTLELANRVEAKLAEARAAGNRYAELVFLICFPACRFAMDDWPTVRRQTREAIQSWVPESRTFSTSNYWAVKTLT